MPIDLTKYDPTSLTEGDVKVLAELMYSTLDANEKTLALFSKSNRTVVVPYLEQLLNDNKLEVACNAAEILLSVEGHNGVQIVAKLLKHEDDDVAEGFADCCPVCDPQMWHH